MLSNIEEWIETLKLRDRNHELDNGFLDKFLIEVNKFEYYVFLEDFNFPNEYWFALEIKWMQEFFPEMKIPVDYCAYNTGVGSIVVMFDDIEIATSFKLRWA